MKKPMRDPRINRATGYGIFFSGLLLVGIGTGLSEIPRMVFWMLGLLIFAGSVLWMFTKVRCPHCNRLLHLKLYDIRRCPYCGKSTKPDDTDE